MGLTGMKGLASITGIVLLIAACSTQSKPEYDPLEVILWEACINDYLAESKFFERESAQLTLTAKDICSPLMPTKKD